jgi:hypothetical protein
VPNFRYFFIIITLLIVQLLLAFQGIDVCDDGFVLTFYQQIFNDPSSVEYNFLYWFAGIVGGLWYQLFEDGGILWFRILAIIVNTTTLLVTYNLLKSFIKRDYLILGLIMVLFVNDYGFLSFYHNQLTALLNVLLIATLYRALKSNNSVLFALVGFILSFTVFTRMPNLILYALVLGIPFWNYLTDKSLVHSIKPIGLLVAGSVVGYVVIFLSLLNLGHLDIMKSAFVTVIDLGGTEESSHNFRDLIIVQFYNYLAIFIELLKLGVFIVAIAIAAKYLRHKVIFKWLTLGLTFLFFIYWFNTANIYPVYALCLIGSLVLSFRKSINVELRLISFLSLISLLTISVGSAGGINNSGFMAIWIGLPLFIHLVGTESLFRNQIKVIVVKSLIWVFFMSFSCVKVYQLMHQAYFDPGLRTDKIYAINSDKAKFIYTTERRAKIINDLLMQLENYIEPNDYLLAYDKIPMIHFLTETRPYMYNPWVWIYDYNSFEKKLHKAEGEIKDLPIVVQQKFETIYEFSEPQPDYMATDKTNTDFHSNERNTSMKDFLERNNYTVVWSNDYFNIYKSEN